LDRDGRVGAADLDETYIDRAVGGNVVFATAASPTDSNPSIGHKS
jgi:hypothetical protein